MVCAYEHTLLITELAAYLHDIGVKVSKEKYGNSQPQHQEAEGPAIAKNPFPSMAKSVLISLAKSEPCV